MRVTQIGNIYQLAFMATLFPVNCYLVDTKEGLILIDAGLAYHAKAIEKVAKKIGKPITHILLTHAHADHIGAVSNLKAAHPEIKFMISERDAKLLKNDLSLEEGEGELPIRGGVPANFQALPDRLLKEGDQIAGLTCYEVPGHTPGLMAFMEASSGALIVGDAFQTRGGVTTAAVVNPLFPFPGMATWDKEKALTSAQKLIDLSPKLLCAGHGSMLPNPINAMQKAVDRGIKA